MFSIEFGDADNRFMNFLEMNELVLPFKWHSFCVSLSSKKALVYHNGNKQGNQTFNLPNKQKKLPILNSGILGGTKFKGFVVDFHIFGRELSERELSSWTRCQIQETVSFSSNYDFFPDQES